MKRLLVAVLILVALTFSVTMKTQAISGGTSASNVLVSCNSVVATVTSSASYVAVNTYSYVEMVSRWTNYSVTPGVPTRLSMSFPAQASGTIINVMIFGGTTADAYNNWDNQTFFNDNIACTETIPGPGIPSGFLLRTITCNTPVYNMAGGDPVGNGDKITAGQSWFVSPTVKKDAKGRSWTETFIGGISDGFIPSNCVGGKPAGYSGS